MHISLLYISVFGVNYLIPFPKYTTLAPGPVGCVGMSAALGLGQASSKPWSLFLKLTQIIGHGIEYNVEFRTSLVTSRLK